MRISGWQAGRIGIALFTVTAMGTLAIGQANAQAVACPYGYAYSYGYGCVPAAPVYAAPAPVYAAPQPPVYDGLTLAFGLLGGHGRDDHDHHRHGPPPRHYDHRGHDDHYR